MALSTFLLKSNGSEAEYPNKSRQGCKHNFIKLNVCNSSIKVNYQYLLKYKQKVMAHQSGKTPVTMLKSSKAVLIMCEGTSKGVQVNLDLQFSRHVSNLRTKDATNVIYYKLYNRSKGESYVTVIFDLTQIVGW